MTAAKVDDEGRSRGAVWLPLECWDWLRAVADHDGSSRSDLVEGLVLLAMDRDQAAQQGSEPGA